MSVIFCASANIHSDKFLALVNYLYGSGLETPTLNNCILHLVLPWTHIRVLYKNIYALMNEKSLIILISLSKHLISPLQALEAQITAVSTSFGTLS